MQTRPLLAALVLLAPFAGVSFGTAATAAEPDFQATVAGARAAAFQDYLPVAQLGELAGFDRGWSVNTFYVVWTGERPALTPHYVARRQIGGQNTSGQTSPTTELWADSRTCQGLIPVLTAMEQLPDARADIPDLGRETTETAAPVPAGVRLPLEQHGAGWSKRGGRRTGNQRQRRHAHGEMVGPNPASPERLLDLEGAGGLTRRQTGQNRQRQSFRGRSRTLQGALGRSTYRLQPGVPNPPTRPPEACEADARE